MSCPAYITDLAQQIAYSLGSPSGQSVPFIQSRLVSPSMIGELNNLLTTCYVAESGAISPPLGQTEQAIYGLVYQVGFYNTRLNQTLGGLNPGVVTIQDGDSRVSFTSPVDIARIYRDMRKQSWDELMSLVYAYRQNESQPSSTDFVTIANVPGAAGYVGNGYTPAQYPYGYYRE